VSWVSRAVGSTRDACGVQRSMIHPPTTTFKPCNPDDISHHTAHITRSDLSSLGAAFGNIAAISSSAATSGKKLQGVDAQALWNGDTCKQYSWGEMEVCQWLGVSCEEQAVVAKAPPASAAAPRQSRVVKLDLAGVLCTGDLSKAAPWGALEYLNML